MNPTQRHENHRLQIRLYYVCHRDKVQGYHATVGSSGCGILADDTLDSFLILHLVSLEQVVRLGLGGRLGIGVVQKILDAQEDLLDSDSRLPSLVFVEDRQADGTGWVDIRMEQRRDEFAYKTRDLATCDVNEIRSAHLHRYSHLGGFVGYSGRFTVSGHLSRYLGGMLTLRKRHRELEEAALPDSLFFARNAAFPVLEVKDAFLGSRGLCIEGERMVAAPLLAGRKSVLRRVHPGWLWMTYRSSCSRF